MLLSAWTGSTQPLMLGGLMWGEGDSSQQRRKSQNLVPGLITVLLTASLTCGNRTRASSRRCSRLDSMRD